jgi:hypothetical protein
VLRGSAALAGFTMDYLGTTEFQLLRTFHDRRLQVAWEIHRWPELCPVEQRQFRASYDETGATVYAAGAQVLDPVTQMYFQSLVAANNQPPTVNGVENSAYWAVCRTSYTADPFDPTAIYNVGDQVQNLLDLNFYQRTVATGAPEPVWTPANWGLLTVFERNIAFNQPWAANVIGEIMGAWDQDPRITTKLVKLPFTLDQDGAQFVQLRNTFNYGWNPASTNFSYVWLLYRLQRPMLTGDAFNPTLVYTTGQQMYYLSPVTGTGDFWTATTTTNAGDTPDSAPGEWSVVQIPYIFRQYLIEAAYADWLTANEKDSTASEARAEHLLEMEADKLQRQQQQVNRFDWRIV